MSADSFSRSGSLVFFIGSTLAFASAGAQPPQEGQAEEPAEVTVVGSQIKGVNVTDTLPVTVLEVEDIEVAAPLSGDELFRAIPQAGDVAFNESRMVGGINDARGDTASINLRALGTGNTLVLINGRRMVLHPGTQTENLVPVVTVNTNAIPTMGVRRIEVLRDGASALYGTDAVAGVINTVLKSNFDGFTFDLQYGGSEGTDSRTLDGAIEWGMNFNSGKSNISVFAEFTDRDPIFARERPYSRSSDNRALVVGTPFEGDTDFDGRSTNMPWGVFDVISFTGTVRQGTTALTNSSGQFHIQPDINDGCRVDLAPRICIDDGLMSTTADRNLRYNDNDERTLYGGVERANVFVFLNHELARGPELFGEFGAYYSDFNSQREAAASLTATRITIPRTNYWNPFGPVTLPDGTPNPNRLENLNIPASGVDLELRQYRAVDAGPRRINVENLTTRSLVGLRGKFASWDWESALLYSRAKTDDTTSNRISNTLFQQALALSTPAAYNPFNGGNPDDPENGDSSPSDPATIQSFLIDVSRVSETSLAMWDLKLSRNNLFSMPGGNVGLAAGLEVRRETFSDDRDPRLDGTITFTDMVTGATSGSDVMGSSPTPDTSGDRTVKSAYVELALPLVNRAMEIPLVKSLDMQLAGRWEHYDFVGSVTTPKVALSWEPANWLRIRSAWSEGFRAPNLPQLFEKGVERSNTRTDYVRCEADLRAGRIASFDDCVRSQGVISVRSGSKELKAEDSENITAGIVLQPLFLPPKAGDLVITADYWRVEQEGVVGIFGDANALALDYLLRVQGGSNPLVIREAPTQTDIDAFAGTGLEPVGEIISVTDNYMNLQPRKVEGLDLALYYSLDDTPLGSFDLKVNAAKLLTFFQQPSDDAAAIIAAQQAGLINSGFTVEGAHDIVRQDGRPRWRWTASLRWKRGTWGAGWYTAYVGSVYDPDATLDDGTQFVVNHWMTHNAYAQYTFRDGWLDGTRVRLGVRNIQDKDPPLADNDFGYSGELHSARGRYWYASIRKRF
jgi:iron complex outermembrane receptor protein